MYSNPKIAESQHTLDSLPAETVAAALGMQRRGRRWYCAACQPGNVGETPDTELSPGGFVCHKSGARGGILDFVSHARGCDTEAARQWLIDEGLIPPDASQAPPPKDPIERLAQVRGWSPDALHALGCEARGAEVHFPMRDADGEITGYRRRPSDGKPYKCGSKALTVKGGKNGLIHPPALPDDDPVLLTEGETDAAAALHAGHGAVVATPGASPGGKTVKALQAIVRGRAVILAPDLGEAGNNWRDDIGKALSAVQCDVRYIPAGSGDLDERLRREALSDILTEAVPWKPPEPPPENGKAAPAPARAGEAFGFRVNSRGVSQEQDDGQAIWVCGPLFVTAKTRDADGENWGVLLEWQDADGRQHEWACPKGMLSGDCAEFRRMLLDGGLDLAPGSKARNALSTYVQIAKTDARLTVTDKPGWYENVFVTPTETIGGGDDGERVRLQSLNVVPALKTAGTLEEWQHRIGCYCVGNSRLVLSVSLAFAAPLIERTGAENGGIHLSGQSSTGKTRGAIRAAASVCGPHDFLKRWRATTNGLEAVAAAHNDLPLVLDELSQVDAKEAGQTAYMLMNGEGKHRARRDGLARPPQSWRLLLLSAGEVNLSTHMAEGGKRSRAGQEVRLADVPADADAGYGVFENLHGYADGAKLADAINDAAREVYGTPMRAYLDALVEIPAADVAARISVLRADFLREALPPGADGQAYRVADRFAFIAAGGELATALGVTGWQQGEAIQAARTCFQAWLDKRGGAGAQETEQALRAVRHFLELHGESRFQDRDSPPERPIINRAGHRQRSQADETRYYVFREVWRNEVCNGLDPQFVARTLRDSGFLETDRDGRLTKTVRGLGHVYCVKEGIVHA